MVDVINGQHKNSTLEILPQKDDKIKDTISKELMLYI